MTEKEWRYVRARHLIVLDRLSYPLLAKRLRVSVLEAMEIAKMGSVIWYCPRRAAAPW
jgi:hypothetical protein